MGKKLSGSLLIFLVLLSGISARRLAADSLKEGFGCKFKVGTSVSPHELSGGKDFIIKHFNSITIIGW